MPQLSNFQTVSKYLSRFYENSRTEYTLDNMRRLLKYLGDPQDQLKVIHVAGTSGKTSTAYYVAELISKGGYKTGLTVSPHVDQLNERVQINGHPISEKEFCDSISYFLDLVAKSPVKPSWFEVVVAFAYWYFAEQRVDYAVVEVGLGGLKDGTNVIHHADKVCVITDIGFDHVGILGNTLSEIAEQKAGIIQPGNIVFTYRQVNEVMHVIKKKTDSMQGKLKVVDDFYPDNFQKRNWHLAHAVYEFLGERDNLRYLTSKELNETKQIVIPGRMDIRSIGGKTVIMDGAHNVQKMTAFLSRFNELYPETKPAILIGVKDGKEYKELVPLLTPIASRVITTSFESSQDLPIKSMNADELAAAFKALGVRTKSIPDHEHALKVLLECPEDVLVITGSFYLLGQIRKNTVI